MRKPDRVDAAAIVAAVVMVALVVLMIVFAIDPLGRFSKRKADPSEIKVEMMIDGEWRDATPKEPSRE